MQILEDVFASGSNRAFRHSPFGSVGIFGAPGAAGTPGAPGIFGAPGAPGAAGTPSAIGKALPHVGHTDSVGGHFALHAGHILSIDTSVGLKHIMVTLLPFYRFL